MNTVSENLNTGKRTWEVPQLQVIEINSLYKLLEIELEAANS